MVWRVRDAHFGRLVGRVALSATAVCALVLATSCSALSGSSDNSGGANPQGLEKATIKVGAIAGASSATLYIAEDKGYFKAQGLNVQIVTTTNGATALTQLQGKALDITLANDVSGIQGAIQGAPLKLVFDGPNAAPDTYVVTAMPSANITSLAQLQGKTVGVSSLNDAVVATLRDSLIAVNVQPDTVHFVSVPYANVEAALKSGQVDAAVSTEPYLTEGAETLGIRPVEDVFPLGSESASLPIAGYFSTESFVKDDPKTLAAFQRAMEKAATDAANRQIVEQSIHTHLPKLNQQVLDVMALPGFPADLDPSRIQRVADLMQNAGFIKGHFNVASILVPLAPASS